MSKGNRFSSLPIAEKCARAPALSSMGATRAAAVSSVFHAKCAGAEGWRDAYTRLDAKEQDEVDRMQRPTTIVLEGGVALDYDSAHKEVSLGLNDVCGFVPKGHPDAITEGTCDLYWVRGRTLYLADIKRSEYTSADGPRSLQVKGYALAVAMMLAGEIDGYVTGVWAATEGLWSWSEYIALDSDECFEDWQRVKAAALHVDGDFSKGRHCRGCYGREKCPAYLVAPEHATDSLARYMTGELTQQSALELLEFMERVKTTMEAAKELVKAHANAVGGIFDGEGKVWREVEFSTKPSFDHRRFELDHPEIAQQYTKLGGASFQHRWCNDPAFDEARKQATREKAKEKRLLEKAGL